MSMEMNISAYNLLVFAWGKRGYVQLNQFPQEKEYIYIYNEILLETTNDDSFFFGIAQ